MSSLKTQINLFRQKAKSFWSSFDFRKRIFHPGLNQQTIDRKLVYSLSTKKIPNTDQVRHLSRFLNPRELVLVKICALVVLANAVYLGIVFFQKHIELLPVAGGEYIEGAVGYPENVNPLYAANRDIDADLARLVYSSLLKYDGEGRLVNDLAENIQIENGKEYKVALRHGVKWQTGGELAADDVLFTFNLIQNSDYRSSLRSSFIGVTAEKIDDYTVKFVLSEPYAPFPELLTFGIMPKGAWQDIGPGSAAIADLNLKPVGSGPYRFKSLVKTREGDLKEYRLEINENYYGTKPYIKNITFIFFVNYQEAVRAFNDNKVMSLSYLPFESRKDILAKNSVRFNELARPQVVSLFFNSAKNKTLAEKDVRVALAAALDKKSILENILDGTYRLADGPLPDTSSAYNPNVTRYNYDPALAATTIKAKPLRTVLTVVGAGSNVALAEKIKDYWRTAGIEVSIRIISGDEVSTVIKNRDFEIFLYGEEIGGDPDVYAFWHSSQASTAGFNLSGYSNVEVDKLLAEARVETDSETRKAKYQKFQEIITADLPAIFLYYPTYTYIQSGRLSGFSGTAVIEPSDRWSGVSDWYLKTKKKINW